MENEHLVVTTKNNIKIIRFNKPEKKNALDYDMYLRITEILNDAAKNEDISMVVMTGTNDFYCSGNDLSAEHVPTEIFFPVVEKFMKAFITFPKILIALVNGPAIGIAVTTLPFFDFVFASEKAYFCTPFSNLNIIAEGASSITFPKLLGQRTALKMLMMNYKMPAKEALECELVSFVYKHEEFNEKAWDYISHIEYLPIHSLLGTKKMIRRLGTEELLKTTEIELEEIKRMSYNRSKL